MRRRASARKAATTHRLAAPRRASRDRGSAIRNGRGARRHRGWEGRSRRGAGISGGGSRAGHRGLRCAARREAGAARRARAAAYSAKAALDRAGAARERALLEAELLSAHLDDLTGAYRREIGTLALTLEIDRARRADGRFILAFVDVDDLKLVNDRYGHAAGDRVGDARPDSEDRACALSTRSSATAATSSCAGWEDRASGSRAPLRCDRWVAARRSGRRD